VRRAEGSALRSAFGPPPESRRRVRIARGVRDEILVLIDGRLASLTRPETLSALKTAGAPIVRQLCVALDAGSTEAKATAAWLLGAIGSRLAIPALARPIEGARWRGEAPVVLRRAAEALLRLGPPGIDAFDRAVRPLASDDLTRLLLIRHASAELAAMSPRPRVNRRTLAGWARALETYLGRIERLAQVSEVDRQTFQRLVLEGYGVSIEEDRAIVPRLIDALKGYPVAGSTTHDQRERTDRRDQA